MTNANDPINAHLTYDQTTGNPNGFIEGMTKREYFAAMALQGLCANYLREGVTGWNVKSYANESVELADALINALNR